jgi:hypothetical protein
VTWLLSLVMGAGVPAKFAKPVLIAGLFVLALAALGLGKVAYDRSVIRQHEAKQDAATAKADRKADTHAADQRRTDDARSTAESAEIKEAVDEARRIGRDPRAAYYECVRKQQAARRERKPPADC